MTAAPSAAFAALACASLLTAIAVWHFYWGFGGRVGFDVALPRHPGSGGRRVFTPGPLGAHAVGAALLVAVLFIAAQAGWVTGWPLPAPATRAVVALMALIFGVRAVGWFRYAGWFKQVRDTRFARYDTWLYCPLCLLLSLGLARLAAA